MTTDDTVLSTHVVQIARVALALRPGTRVRLPDGSIAYATPDRRVGYKWDGTYRTRQGERVDLGWRREQLEVL